MSATNAARSHLRHPFPGRGSGEGTPEVGLDMKKLSIVAKDSHHEEQVVGTTITGDRMKNWGSSAPSGRALGMLFGAAFFAIPGIGPVLVAGPLVAWIVELSRAPR